MENQKGACNNIQAPFVLFKILAVFPTIKIYRKTFKLLQKPFEIWISPTQQQSLKSHRYHVQQ